MKLTQRSVSQSQTIIQNIGILAGQVNYSKLPNLKCIVKTMLKALISYFPEKEGHTGVGALEYSVDERKKLAIQSRKWVCPACGPIASLVSEKEEEKQPEETKAQPEIAADEEVPVELAGEERPQEEESEEESSESEESKQEIPRNKNNLEEPLEKKTVYQYHKDESSKNVMEIDLQYLQSGTVITSLMYTYLNNRYLYTIVSPFINLNSIDAAYNVLRSQAERSLPKECVKCRETSRGGKSTREYRSSECSR